VSAFSGLVYPPMKVEEKIRSKVPASFRHFHAVEIKKPLNQNVESDIV